jgi:hypothetical protein
MRNRTPVPRDERPAVPAFTPVPRLTPRHDGWTPARQKAFIEALADTGSVSRAAALVNMAQRNCYALRRAAGAEEFRRAWDAALDFGVARMKDIAFERAIEGQLVPVFSGGKLMGYQRKRNDALLMFCLRHYGQDASGKRTTVNYVSTRASVGTGAGAGAGPVAALGRPWVAGGDPARQPTGAAGGGAGAAAAAEASVTTVRTVLGGDGRGGSRHEADDRAAALMEAFAGSDLDAAAQADIRAALEAHAARVQAAERAYRDGGLEAKEWALGDADQPFVQATWADPCYGELVDAAGADVFRPFTEGEEPWQTITPENPATLPAWPDDGAED